MLGNIAGISSSGVFDSFRVFFAVSNVLPKVQKLLSSFRGFIGAILIFFLIFFVFCFYHAFLRCFENSNFSTSFRIFLKIFEKSYREEFSVGTDKKVRPIEMFEFSSVRVFCLKRACKLKGP